MVVGLVGVYNDHNQNARLEDFETTQLSPIGGSW
jgi:hypothetical protein